MQSKAATVAAYLKSLPEDRRKALQAIRKVVNDNLDPKVKEAMAYGMPGWVVPLSVYPDGYHCAKDTPLPFASLASQKNHMALYLFCVYSVPGEAERLAEEWKAAGKKLDMGKSCLRFKKLSLLSSHVFDRLTSCEECIPHLIDSLSWVLGIHHVHSVQLDPECLIQL